MEKVYDVLNGKKKFKNDMYSVTLCLFENNKQTLKIVWENTLKKKKRIYFLGARLKY